MIPAIAKKGQGFKGAVHYITHDIGKKTSDRVMFAKTLNMRTDDPAQAAHIMAWTAEHAADLKKAAGLAPTGNKVCDPVYHFSLNWDATQNPGKAEMLSAADSALKRMGLDGHEAVLAAHNDKDHLHVHVVVSRINPETGRAVNVGYDYDRLQKWAWEYEKTHGYIFCVERALKYERDPRTRDELQRRLDLDKERSNDAVNRPRAQWNAEQNAAYPKSKKARDLRSDLKEKTAALQTETAHTKDQHKAERSDLYKAYTQQKAALCERQKGEYLAEARAETQRQSAAFAAAQKSQRETQARAHKDEWGQLASKYRNEERGAVDRLFKSQRGEFRSFLETSHRQGFIGAVASAVQATRQNSGNAQAEHFGQKVAHFLAMVMSKDQRATSFLAGQKAERDKLRESIRAAQRPRRDKESQALKDNQKAERDALKDRQAVQRKDMDELTKKTPAYTSVQESSRARQKAERDALRERYVQDKGALSVKQGEEWEKLRAKWTTHNAARHDAWGAYRQARDQAQKPQELSQQFEGNAQKSKGTTNVPKTPGKTAAPRGKPGFER